MSITMTSLVNPLRRIIICGFFEHDGTHHDAQIVVITSVILFIDIRFWKYDYL